MSKTLKTRMKQKHETEANWLKSSLIPLEGEIIIYEPDTSHNYSRLKVGDGVTGVNDLPFLNRDIAEQLRRQNDRGVAGLNDDEDAASDVLWSSRKTLGVMEQTLAATVGNFLGVNFTLIDGQYVGKKIGPYANYKPGEDYNNFNMYGNRKLVGVDLSNNKFTILGTYNSIAEATDALAENADIEFFVQQPKFYYKITGTNADFSIYIADTKIDDTYKIHPAFYRNGYYKDYLYIAKDCVAGTPTNSNGTTAYDGVSLTSISKANTKKITGGWMALSRDGCRTGVKAYNSKLSLYDIWALSASQILFMVEYGTLDVQSALCEGVTKIPHPSTGSYFNKTMLSLNTPLAEISGSSIELTDVAYANFSFSSKNLIPYKSSLNGEKNRGITVTVNEDGTLTLNGTNDGTAASTFTLVSKFSLDKIIYTSSGGTFIDSAKTYYVNLTIDTHKDNKWVKTFGNMGNASGTQIDNSEGLYDDGTISLSITKGATVTDFVIKPQLEIGTSRTEYTPHISDFSNIKVQKTQDGQITILNSLTDNNVTGTATYQANTDGALISAIYPSSDNQGLKIFNNYGTYAYYIDYLTGAGDLTSSNSRCVEVSYRWENNLWGGPYKIFVDGMNIKFSLDRLEYFPYISTYPNEYADDKINGAYIKKSSFGIFWNQGGFPTRFHNDLLIEGLFFGMSDYLSNTSTSGIPDHTNYYTSTVHCAVPCIGCVYNWETPGGIMGGPGLFQYELVNQNSYQFDSSYTDAYNNYTTAKAIYIP